MSDAICPRCGDDNITDYPVCDGCATVAHFPYRATCLHCERKRAATMQHIQITALLTELVKMDIDHPQREGIRPVSHRQLQIRVHSLAERAAALLARMEEK